MTTKRGILGISWALDLGILGLTTFLIFYGKPSGADLARWMPVHRSDSSCLLSEKQSGVALQDGKIIEEGAFPYPVYFERLSSQDNKATRYWILYTEHSTLERTEEVRSIASGKEREPVALLRDDNADSFPDVAFLFYQDREDPVELRLGNVSADGCEFWRSPVSQFLRTALEKKSWHMGLAHSHSWIPFLEKLYSFEITPYKNSEDLSVLAEPEAHRLFELMTYSVSSFRGQAVDEENIFEGTQQRATKLLTWMGLRHRSLRAPSSAAVWVDGMKEPLKSTHYDAPVIYVTKDGQEVAAVFDVLLFNDWTTESEWSRRVVRPALK